MKVGLPIILIVLLIGCHLNTRVYNDEFDKMDAEKITGAFYRGVLQNDYAKVDTLFSPLQYKGHKRDSIGINIKNIHNQYEPVITWDLIDWKTVDVSGTDTNNEYVLKYNVEFDSTSVTETFL